ncbi:MAG TPA: quinone-dependent dihydroorotate dehydrogenase [Caulobacteraceae bacterium]|nr:quinone-dependent dihydroorotate dehydrogenase [Caulobacteraceae bacterium]
MSALHDAAARALGGLEPETAHGLTIAALHSGLGPRLGAADPALAVDLTGLRLDSCIGLAAGFDKNALVPDAMLAAGFGFVECGTVTPKPQPGNPKPRLFRLREDRAIINRLGFNNEGLDAAAARLARRVRRGVVGANVGANRDSADRIADYVQGLARLWPHADYFVLNVSSPNTPGLRALQAPAALDDLLGRVAATREGLAAAHGRRPVFLKVAPDLEPGDVDPIVEAAVEHGIDGVIVGNTTLGRPPTLKSPARIEAGGLSGAPLMPLSTEQLGRFHKAARGRLILIGVGGIASGRDAYMKIRAGAHAVQLYSALVFEGPGLIGRIRTELVALLAADGFSNVAEAVGADARLS